MYQVINEDYPRLEAYLCYECGFHADTILMKQKKLYQAYQQLFLHSKRILVPKKVPAPKNKELPTESQQRNKTTDDSTEPKIEISTRIKIKVLDRNKVY